jgi:hypothetical protein
VSRVQILPGPPLDVGHLERLLADGDENGPIDLGVVVED